MTSSHALMFSLALVSIGAAGCSSRTTTTYQDTGAAGADAAMPIDAASTGDAGDDAATPTDAGHDAANVTTTDSGCTTTPVCMDLPSSCHYDNTLEPCRCGMVICDPPASGCSPACGAGEFCEYPVDTCGASGGGTCTVIPDICTDLFSPVCGCDGHTYSNPCEAQAAGQSIVYHDACETPTDCRTAGCTGGATCMPCRGTGYICVDPGIVC